MSESESEGVATVKKIENYMFNLSEKIGEGSFSQVFRGTDITRNSTVAVKKIRIGEIKSKIARRLLDCEIAVLQLLQHPHVIRCLDVHTSINNCYIVTEYCQGGDLDQHLRQFGPFPEAALTRVAHQVLQALQYLADLGIVHRDLKVSNILVHEGGYKLADFGFAIRASHVFKDISVGSPVYMSPEGLINNLYGPKTDVWAFGILLYELLHGVAPLATCKSEEELKRKVMEPPIFTIDCSQDLKELILSCLTVQEKERPTVRLLGESSYMRRAKRETEGEMELEKDLTSTIFSSEASRSEPPLPSFPRLSYDSAVSLIHYCRLFNKIRKMCVPSAVFARSLFWLSSQLTRATISMENVSAEKQTNLRAIIKEYHEKYEGEFGSRVEAGVRFGSVVGECERKMVGEARMLNHLKFLAKESEHLARSLESGSIDHFFKRSKAKQYLNTISTR